MPIVLCEFGDSEGLENEELVSQRPELEGLEPFFDLCLGSL